MYLCFVLGNGLESRMAKKGLDWPGCAYFFHCHKLIVRCLRGMGGDT
jgi:hypothetical protein